MMKRMHINEFHPVWDEHEQGEACCIIDVRTPEEYAGGHVPGAELMPLHAIPTKAHEIPKDRDVYLICRSGARSAQAAQYLAQEHDHTRLVNVEGGTMAWIEAGHPVEH
ncbi:MAG TPA: rhodanese-like domain-containing protein [Mariprofundaceae bacterium]|nr:rhodanese-like domain-containing protein [Mariprofundaceae bacterium]